MDYDGKVIIDPSYCDEDREVRSKEVTEIWNIVASSQHLIRVTSLFLEALDLFKEALSCYQNGTYMAAAAMCGSALESAIYRVSIATNLRACREHICSYRTDERAKIACRNFRKCLEIAKLKRYIDNKLKSRIEKIRRFRNFAIHYSQRLERELTKLMTVILTRRREEDTTSKSLQTISWILRKKARRLLKKTAEILIHIAENVTKALPT